MSVQSVCGFIQQNEKAVQQTTREELEEQCIQRDAHFSKELSW